MAPSGLFPFNMAYVGLGVLRPFPIKKPGGGYRGMLAPGERHHFLAIISIPALCTPPTQATSLIYYKGLGEEKGDIRPLFGDPSSVISIERMVFLMGVRRSN